MIKIFESKFREFLKQEYSRYGGTTLPDGSEPLIYKGKYAIIIISGSVDDNDFYSVSINNGKSAAWDNKIKSKEEALKLANTLIKYADDDCNFIKACKKLDMETYFD